MCEVDKMSPNNLGKKSQVIHSQITEIVYNISEVMHKEAEQGITHYFTETIQVRSFCIV